MYPAAVNVFGIRCVVTDPEVGLCAASGHSSTIEALRSKRDRVPP